MNPTEQYVPYEFIVKKEVFGTDTDAQRVATVMQRSLRVRLQDDNITVEVASR